MTKTTIKTMSATVGALLVAAMLLLPAVGSAQSGDTAYCAALVTTYERHIEMGSARSRLPQSLESRHAVEQCRAGDSSGIPGIERALEGAKIPLPPRG